MKPLALIERALENSSQAGDVVADLFLGSGSTLIACERTGPDLLRRRDRPPLRLGRDPALEAFTRPEAVKVE